MATTSQTASAHLATITVDFDVSTKSYAISNGARQITFSPGDRSSGLSSAAADVYMKTDGATTDTLTLTRPGTSGALTYHYVGGGYWQHSLTAGGSGSGTLDAFSYGMPTVDSAVPRSGHAEYAVDLIGGSTYNGVSPLAGTGLLQVDFGRGLVITDGTISSGFYAGTTSFSGEARLAATNAFGGSFRINSGFLASDPYYTLTGDWQGRFYGPSAQEVGAAFAVADSYGHIAAVGTLLGRSPGLAAGNSSVNPPTVSEMFAADHATLATTLNVPYPVDTVASSFSATTQSHGAAVVGYDPVSKSYSIVTDGGTSFLGLGITTDQNRIQTFEQQGSIANDLLIYTADQGQYVAAGRSYRSKRSGIALGDYSLDYFTFGLPTADAAVPRVGKAGYGVTLIGTAADKNFNSLLSLDGKGTVVADFGSGLLSLDGYVHYAEHYSYLGHPSATGDTLLSGAGAITSGSSRIGGTLQFGVNSTYTGTFNGGLYGPSAEEIGAAFTAADGNGNIASGAFFGAQDPAILAPPTTLLTLTQPTDLFTLVSQEQYSTTPFSSLIGIRANAPSSSYRLNFFGTLVTLSVDPASSDASFTNLTPTTLANTQVTARMLTPGDGNPTLGLSYTSFADVRAQSLSSPAANRVLVIDGLATTAAQMPRAGSASYDGLVFGYGGSRSVVMNYGLTGTSHLDVNFTSGTFATTLGIVGTPTTGAAVTFDPLTFTGTVGSAGQLAATGGQAGASYLGQLFGPKATDFGAVFQGTGTSAALAPGDQIALTGSTLGKQR